MKQVWYPCLKRTHLIYRTHLYCFTAYSIWRRKFTPMHLQPSTICSLTPVADNWRMHGLTCCKADMSEVFKITKGIYCRQMEPSGGCRWKLQGLDKGCTGRTTNQIQLGTVSHRVHPRWSFSVGVAILCLHVCTGMGDCSIGMMSCFAQIITYVPCEIVLAFLYHGLGS